MAAGPLAIHDITGVVLAGGAGQRMGGEDKGLVPLAGQPMIGHVIGRFRPQVGSLAINANRNQARYAAFGLPVCGDAGSGFHGPLAGFDAALTHAATAFVALVPCDAPFLPLQLVARLGEALRAADAELAVAATDGRLQPVFALLSRALHADLQHALAAGERKIDRWYARHRMVEVDFSAERDAFANVNTPEERAHAEQRLRQQTGEALSSRA